MPCHACNLLFVNRSFGDKSPWDSSHVLAMVNMWCWVWVHRHLFDSITESFLGIRPGLELLAPVVIYVNFWGKHQTVVHGACCTILHSSQNWYSNLPAFSLILLFSITFFLIITNLTGVKWSSLLVLSCLPNLSSWDWRLSFYLSSLSHTFLFLVQSPSDLGWNTVDTLMYIISPEFH